MYIDILKENLSKTEFHLINYSGVGNYYYFMSGESRTGLSCLN